MWNVLMWACGGVSWPLSQACLRLTRRREVDVGDLIRLSRGVCETLNYVLREGSFLSTIHSGKPPADPLVSSPMRHEGALTQRLLES